MITSAFLNIFFAVISTLIEYLPTVTSNTAFISAITTGSSYISAVYLFLPFIVSTLLLIIAFDITFESAYLLYKAIYWVIRRFPTQS